MHFWLCDVSYSGNVATDKTLIAKRINVKINIFNLPSIISECIPPSLRFFSGNEQVDLARKMQEDPLYAIKKKEMETRNQLLKNPVKLKQLRQLVSKH